MKSIRTIAAAAGLALVAIGCSEEGNVFSLEVGTCINSGATGQISNVDTIECEEPHLYEVFHLFDMDDSDEFPGDDAVGAASEECFGSAFTDFVGTEYSASALYVQTLVPTPSSWDQGDREIVCMVFATNDDGVTATEREGSAEGAEI